MKLITVIFLIATLISPSFCFADKKQDTCLEQVKSIIAAIDVSTSKAGKEKKLNGYTKKDIVNELKTKQPCEVLNELNILPFKK